jgi:hypothetical protein
MSDKLFNKNIISSYSSSVIPVCRLLKAHATNIMLLPENKILMQPSLNGVRNYMIAKPKVDYSNFVYTYFTIPEISKTNTKFRKTKSEIDWEINDGTNYLVVKNEEMEPCKSPIINNPNAIKDVINATYKNLPNWDNSNIQNIICDESSSDYNQLSDSFISDMSNKKLCEIKVNGNSILISRPFLGDLKKTEYVGYRIIDEDDSRIVLKFKQVEDLGNIYTYAAFLII